MQNQKKDLFRIVHPTFKGRWVENTPRALESSSSKLEPGTRIEFGSFADETPEERLERAVFDGGLKDVQEAVINRGANVDAPYENKPMWLFFSKWLDLDVNKKGRDVTNAMVELMVSKSRNIYEPLMDDIHLVVRKYNVEDTSTLFLAAIKETGGAFRWDLKELIASNGDTRDPYHPARTHARDNVLAIHKRVAERLANPVTVYEKSVVASVTGENKTYWGTELVFPDLATIPLPSREFMEAVSRTVHLTGQLLDADLPPYMRLGIPRPPHIRAASTELLSRIDDALYDARNSGYGNVPERKSVENILNQLKQRHQKGDPKPEQK